MPSDVLLPPTLRAGDKIRFVSPASTPDESGVLQRKAVLERWGLKVDLGQHVFLKRGFLAGTDEERLTDLNSALRDRDIRLFLRPNALATDPRQTPPVGTYRSRHLCADSPLRATA